MANMAHLGSPQGAGCAGSVLICSSSDDSFRSAEHGALQLASTAWLRRWNNGHYSGSCLSDLGIVHTGPVEGLWAKRSYPSTAHGDQKLTEGIFFVIGQGLKSRNDKDGDA